jgi:hypothetical protein
MRAQLFFLKKKNLLLGKKSLLERYKYTEKKVD